MWLIWIALACQPEEGPRILPPHIDAPDHDQDGFIAQGPFGNDCDDDDAEVHPGVPDLGCDGVDNDCDGADGVDADDDGATVCADDCDDADPRRSRLQVESCDRIDNDCDGVADDDFDRDGDGWLTCGALSPTPLASVIVTEGIVTSLSSVDINHDGALELVAFDEDHGTVTVYRSAPGAPLSQVSALTTPRARSVRSAGDLDGDGLDELAVAVQTREVQSQYALALFHGEIIDGQPTFSQNPTFWTPGEDGFGLASVSLGDVDHDGRADLALYGQRSGGDGPTLRGELWIAHGAAQGALERVESLSTLRFITEPALHGADLDGDGQTEVIAIRPDPFGSWTSWVYRVPAVPGAEPTTLDRLINSDAVVTTGPSPDGSGAEQLITLIRVDAAPGGVAAGYQSDPFGNLSLASWFIQPTSWALGDDRVQVVPDLDHDGRPDLLVAAHNGAPVLEVWGLDERGEARRSGHGSAAAPLGDFMEVSVEAGDLDGDGRLEVVLAETVDRARTTLWVFELGMDCDDADPGRNVECP